MQLMHRKVNNVTRLEKDVFIIESKKDIARANTVLFAGDENNLHMGSEKYYMQLALSRLAPC